MSEQDPTPPSGDDGKLKAAREEAAARRVENRELKVQLEAAQAKAAKLDKLEAEQQTDAERQAAQIAELQAALQERDAQVAKVEQQAAFERLASKAGVSPDAAALMDLSKFDLSDEAATIERLGVFAVGKPANGGSGSSPAKKSGLTLETIRAMSSDEINSRSDEINLFLTSKT